MKQNERTAGFTLVELIVVIAIMGILAGVGTVGYGGYIKSAHKNTDKTTIGEVYRAVDTAGKTYAYDVTDVGQAGKNGLQIPVGFIMLTNGEKTDGTTGNTLQVITTSDATGTANKAMLESILSDTFGSGYATDLKLLSDIWTESTIPTMFAETQGLYSTMQTLTNVLASTANNRILGNTIKSKFPNVVNYTDNSGNVVGEKVVVGMANGVASVDKATFLDVWMNVESNGDINCAFTLNAKGVETYTAARRAYNEGFAAYVESRTDISHDKTTMVNKGSTFSPNYQPSTSAGAGSASDHALQITQYGSGIGDLIVSDVICTNAFTTDAVQTSLISGHGNLDDDVQHCAQCKALYNEYKTSEQCRQNGIAFYDAMVTISETQDTAFNNEGGFWDYYDTYIGNFSNLYTGIQDEQKKYKSAVVLTVYYRDGILVPAVSPNNYLNA